MSTASPRTLAELLSAGAFIQAGIDSDFRASSARFTEWSSIS